MKNLSNESILPFMSECWWEWDVTTHCLQRSNTFQAPLVKHTKGWISQLNCSKPLTAIKDQQYTNMPLSINWLMWQLLKTSWMPQYRGTYLLCQPWSRLVYFFRTPSRCRLLRAALCREGPDPAPPSRDPDPIRCSEAVAPGPTRCSCLLPGHKAGLSWRADRFMVQLLLTLYLAALRSIPRCFSVVNKSRRGVREWPGRDILTQRFPAVFPILLQGWDHVTQ